MVSELRAETHLHPGNDSPHWYALQTRSRHEKVVAAQLTSKGIANYLPLCRQAHRWSDRRKMVDVPLFPGYAFVCMSCLQQEMAAVLGSQGAVRLVGAGAFPTAIPNEQIESIRVLLQSKAAYRDYLFLKVGQRVRIRGGCLNGIEGILVALPHENRVVISLDAIQRSLAIDVSDYGLEILSGSAHASN